MTDSHTFKALSLCMAACVGMLAIAACAIRLRDDESLTRSTAPAAQESSTTMAAELERCRTITDEKQEMLPECRKIWAENRRQFFGRSGGSSTNLGPIFGFSTSAPPKGENRLVIRPQGKASD
jgi:conjugative transfer region protein TrbK